MALGHTSAAEFTVGTGPLSVTIDNTGSEWMLVLVVENGSTTTQITGCTADGNAVAYADANQDPFLGALGSEDASLHSFFTNTPTTGSSVDVVITQSGTTRSKWGAVIWGTGSEAVVADANEFDHANTSGASTCAIDPAGSTAIGYYLVQSAVGNFSGWTPASGYADLFTEDFGAQVASVGKSNSTITSSSTAGVNHNNDYGRVIALAIKEGVTVPTLVIGDGDHAHTAEALDLVQQHLLAIQDAAHVHAADNVTLDAGATNLVIDDAAHAHTSENLDLVQQHSLAVNDSAHAHTADNVAFSSGPVWTTSGEVLDGTNADHYELTPSRTMTGIGLLVVSGIIGAGDAPNPTITGGGVSWTFIGEEDPTSRASTAWFLADGTPDGSTIDIDYPASSGNGECMALLGDLTNCKTSKPVIHFNHQLSGANANTVPIYHHRLAHADNLVIAHLSLGQAATQTVTFDQGTVEWDEIIETMHKVVVTMPGGASGHRFDPSWTGAAVSDHWSVLEVQATASDDASTVEPDDIRMIPHGGTLPGSWTQTAGDATLTSITPLANEVVAVAFLNRRTGSSADPASVVDGASNAYSKIASVAVDADRVLGVWSYRYGASPPSNTTITIDFTLASDGDCGWLLGISNTQGSTNTDWAGTPVTNADDAATSIGATVSGVDTHGAILAFFGKDTITEDWAFEAGYVPVSPRQSEFNGLGYETQCIAAYWLAGNEDTTPSATAASSDLAVIALEIEGEPSEVSLVVADASHAQTAENLDLVQQHALAVGDSAHALTSENLDLVQTHVLAVDDAAHAHAADNLDLTQIHVLAVDDAAHALTSENVDLSTLGQLGIQDSAHAVSSDEVVLVQQHTLAIQDAAHAHSADNLDLSVTGVLGIQDSTHALTSENLALTQVHVLGVQDSTHLQTADNVALSLEVALGIEDSVHGLTSDNLDLTQTQVLEVADAVHALTSDVLDLVQQYVLHIDDAAHVLNSDAFALIGGELGEPVEDPQAVWVETEGEAVLLELEGYAVLGEV